MKPNIKILTVYSTVHNLAGSRYYKVPRINLQGLWLANLGFQEGDKIALSFDKKKITIVVFDRYDNEKRHRSIVKVNKGDLKEGNIIVQYKDTRNLWRKEIINTVKEGDFYRVTMMPYRVPGIALNDLIEAEEQYGLLFFLRVFQFGGNRTVHLQLYETKFVEEHLVRELRAAGCTWLSRYQRRMTINIPPSAPFDKLIAMFDLGVKSGYWVYQQTRF